MGILSCNYRVIDWQVRQRLNWWSVDISIWITGWHMLRICWCNSQRIDWWMKELPQYTANWSFRSLRWSHRLSTDFTQVMLDRRMSHCLMQWLTCLLTDWLNTSVKQRQLTNWNTKSHDSVNQILRIEFIPLSCLIFDWWCVTNRLRFWYHDW